MHDPFSRDRISKIDTRSVHETYIGWPGLAREGFNTDFEVPDGKVERTVVLGMGGSAAGGDIVTSWLTGRKGVEMAVFKGQVPIGDMRGTLAIACSVSGETLETVQMLRTAHERGAMLMSMSSGGKLAAESKRLGVAHIRIPRALAPRFSLPFIVFTLVSILDRVHGLRSSVDAQEAFHLMDQTATLVREEAPEEKDPAKRIARTLFEATPVIYGPRVTRGVGIRFKNVLNENSKKHALFDGIPDAFHNDVESWEDPTTEFRPMFLRHTQEDGTEKERTDAMVQMLTDAGKAPLEVRGRGKGSLSQIMTMVYELDMVSYYLAVGLGRDPFPVDLIERLKRKT